ncbi:MAG: alpha-L-fucosidase [Endozoicomonas sp.]
MSDKHPETDVAVDAALKAVPAERQLKYQREAFYGFIHFGMNTFTDRGWGTGREAPELFNPSDLDTDQWVAAMKSAGMKGVILTAKHHDGFCLWPSKYTEHSVKNSSWKNGRGDVVHELSESCEKYQMKLGIYLSPWDMNHPGYGTPAYNDYFLNQMTELLSNYGEIFSVWFDGACGEKKKKQDYDWSAFYQLIRKLQPDAVISNSGPDVRWCGNEAGYCRPQEWCVVPRALSDSNLIAAGSQRDDNAAFARKFDATDQDLGSRKAIEGITDLIWYPSEVDVSIRPEWFYHSKEDHKLKSLKKLLRIYFDSIGGNNALLLNVPPDKTGRFQKNDIDRLKALGQALQKIFSRDLAAGARVEAVSKPGGMPEALIDQQEDTHWQSPEGSESSVITLTLPTETTFNIVDLQEFIENGQRIEKFSLAVEEAGSWKTVVQGSTIGNRKLCLFPAVTSRQLRLEVSEARAAPSLRALKIYNTDQIRPMTALEQLCHQIQSRVIRWVDHLYVRFFM